jgi:hypothetical protein
MSNTITATPQNPFAQVVIRTDWTGFGTATQNEVIERSDDGGATWTAVRGSPLRTIGAAIGISTLWTGYVVDTEMPLNTPLLYRAITNGTGPTATTGPVTVTSDGSWLKDPGRPWANIHLLDCVMSLPVPGCPPAFTEPAISLVGDGLATETYAADASLFPILNSAHPADVYALRKDAATAWRVISHTLTALNTLRDFYSAGGPIFLQLDPVYGWPDRYYQPGAVDVSRLTRDLTRPQRFWDVPLVSVDAPGGPAQGTCEANWCIIDSTYATYAALTATGLTWGDVIEGDATTC